jgi:hypothetical protein
MISAIPDTIEVYTKEDLHSMPTERPSELELYILGKIQDLPEFGKDEKPEGALRVMESILCLRDRIRTKKFLVGLAEAISRLESQGKT